VDRLRKRIRETFGDDSAMLLPLLTTPAFAPISRHDKMNFIFNVLLHSVEDDNFYENSRAEA